MTMTLRTRKASWFVSGLLLVTFTLAGFDLVLAQPRDETPRPAFDGEATFEMLGENKLVNIDSVAYASDDGGKFDIYFACSSVRGTDPLRLIDEKDIMRAKSYFSEEKRYGKRFLKISRYYIRVRNIAYIEFGEGSVVIRFNARVYDSFAKLTLSGADAEDFRTKVRGL